jgi:alpha-galactosidase
LTVRAALEGDREAVYHAVALDPLTAAVLTLAEARRMTDEMFVASAAWLPKALGGEK